MADSRVRRLERRAKESGNPADEAEWHAARHQRGERSLMACLGCRTCLEHGGRETSECQECWGTGMAGLDDACMVGSALGDPMCEALAGWKPDGSGLYSGPVGTESISVDAFTGSVLERRASGAEPGPPTLRERTSIVAKQGAFQAVRMAAAGITLLVDELERAGVPGGWGRPLSAERRLNLAKWANARCDRCAEQITRTPTSEAREFWVPHRTLRPMGWLPGFSYLVGVEVLMEGAEAMRRTRGTSSEEAIVPAVRKPVTPWLMGLGWPVMDLAA